MARLATAASSSTAPSPSLSPWRQVALLIRQGVLAELADKERLISPILFGMTLLIMFSFAIGSIEPELRHKIYVAETFLTAFLALQLSFSRVFEPDRQDRVFDLMRSYPVSYTSWFFAKYSLVLLLGTATLLPTMLFSAFLNSAPGDALFSWGIVAIAMLSLAGLAALGILLSAMTLKSNARQILYPLLYFPLTTPVVLAATNASLSFLELKQWTSDVRTWASLLGIFDVIYFTLGILLYGELVDDG